VFLLCLYSCAAEMRNKLQCIYKLSVLRQPQNSTIVLKANSVTLSSSLAGSRAGLRAASELDSVMEFGLSSAIQLASSSLAGRDSSNLVADRFAAGLRPGYVEVARICLRQVRHQVCDQLQQLSVVCIWWFFFFLFQWTVLLYQKCEIKYHHTNCLFCVNHNTEILAVVTYKGDQSNE